MSSSESIHVDRSVDDVYRYIADLRNEPAWHVDIESVPADTPAEPEVGRTVPVRFKPFMGRTDGTFTAVGVERGRSITYRADLAGLRPQITYTVEPDGSGARFSRSVEMRPTGVLVLMTPMMAVMVPRRNRVFVANLKRVLEGSARVPPAGS